MVTDSRYEAAVLPRNVRSPVNDVVMIDHELGSAVGDQGLILETANGGKSWKKTELKEAIPVLEQMDFHCICHQAGQLYISGSPGTLIVRIGSILSDTNPPEAQLIPVPGTSRLNQFRFVDDKHGWAVGTVGTILSTSCL